MSPQPGWQEDAPKKHDDPILPQAFVSWMQALGSPENSAFPEDRVTGPEDRPGAAADSPPETDDLRDNLLRAIQDTEIARRLKCEPPAGKGAPQATAPADPRASSASLAGAAAKVAPPLPSILQPAQFPEAGRIAAAVRPAFTHLVQAPTRNATERLMPASAASARRPLTARPRRAAAARPRAKTNAGSPMAAAFPQSPAPAAPRTATAPGAALTLLVQSPSAVPTPLMPPPAARPRRPVHSVSPQATGSRQVAEAPQAASHPLPAMSAEPAPAVIPPSLLAATNDGFSAAPILLQGREEINHLSGKLARAVGHMARGATQISAQLSNWTVTKAVPAMKRTARAGLQLSIELTNWTVTRVVPAAKRTAQAGFQLSIELKNWTVTKVVPASQRMALAGFQSSIAFKNWTVTRLAPAAKRIGGAATQHSIRRKSRPVAKAPAARARTSSGLKYWLGPRRSGRLVDPPLVAYCWTADTPHGLEIANISTGGIYLRTDVRWPRGGIVSMTLQRTDRAKDSPQSWIVIDFVVVRWSRDGVAGAFLPTRPGRIYYYSGRAENCADQKTLQRFVKHLAVPAYQ